MIVKVQLSLFTTHANQRAIVYDRHRDYLYEGDADQPLLEVMAGRPKAFFEADVVNGKFAINEEVPWQDW